MKKREGMRRSKRREFMSRMELGGGRGREHEGREEKQDAEEEN